MEPHLGLPLPPSLGGADAPSRPSASLPSAPAPFADPAFSPLELAFLGDAYYDLLVREYVLSRFGGNMDKMNRAKQRLVCAAAQSAAIRHLLSEGMLTEEEREVYRKARNHRKESRAKHASVGDYHRATGFEAVLGHLYLVKDAGRIAMLFHETLRYLEESFREGDSQDGETAQGGSAFV